MLEHAVGKSSGGGTDVDAEAPGEVDFPVAKRLRELEAENARLKKIVADLSLDKEMMQDVIKRKL